MHTVTLPSTARSVWLTFRLPSTSERSVNGQCIARLLRKTGGESETLEAIDALFANGLYHTVDFDFPEGVPAEELTLGIEVLVCCDADEPHSGILEFGVGTGLEDDAPSLLDIDYPFAEIPLCSSGVAARLVDDVAIESGDEEG